MLQYYYYYYHHHRNCLLFLVRHDKQLFIYRINRNYVLTRFSPTVEYDDKQHETATHQSLPHSERAFTASGKLHRRRKNYIELTGEEKIELNSD